MSAVLIISTLFSLNNASIKTVVSSAIGREASLTTKT